jgi:molybdopterin-binding protein
MRTEAAIAARGIRKHYGKRVVLDVPELSVPAGTTYALLGSSGAGKSTLLRILGLLERPDAGTVLLDGEEVGPRDRRARMRVAMLFQKPYLFAGTVAANVAYGLRARKVPAPQQARRVAEALERVGLGGLAERDHRALSGGEAQRVALARALVVEPEVLLLDEPLSFIDPLVKERLTREFAALLRSQDVTAVWVTHDQEEAFAVADTVGILHQGRFVASGALDDVMAMPETPWVASFVGMEPPLEGRAVSHEDGITEVDLGGLHVFGLGHVPTGRAAAVAVRPEDVMLFSGGVELPLSSARNRIEAEVADIVPKGAMVRVVLAVPGGGTLASLVSRASVAELGLEPGSRALALFKAAATRVGPVSREEVQPEP